MPYATPSAFISKFGLDETVQLLGDEQQLLTAQLLLDAMAGAWTGSPSADEQAAATSALARMNRQLEVTSNTMDGYLRAAVQLPLPSDTADAGTLEDCCLALARTGLADDSDNATERMKSTADRWMKWLRDVADKRVQLVSTAGQAAPPSGGARSGQATSRYDWDRFSSHC